MSVYTSYVLRVWQVKGDRHWTCRAMLERVSTGRRTGFTDLSNLIAFLQTEVDETLRVMGAADETDTGPAGQGNAPGAPPDRTQNSGGSLP